ncbi:hypothetical protein CVT24_003182 [Panaeolus cyanescens]|uniref:Uncharacterized protein n=1 Tax=Panaeolus cyanescens TaxID=181874 RepID=A0A409VUB8_9AGAR|nr:hypothetical protein CVT24_003182 [Panaeolus cyanescens]
MQNQNSSPSFIYPSTPSTSRHPLSFRPLNSSPLVGVDFDEFDTHSSSPGSPKSSPLLDAQARRKSQYKSLGRTVQTPTTGSRIASLPPASVSSKAYRTRLFTTGNAATGTLDSQKAFIRDRFRARCIERAVNAREKAIKGKRSSASHADDSMDLGDEEEDDAFLMQDELFRRILKQTDRSRQHAYSVSYYDEVGSSFDPDLEDVGEWESELAKPPTSTDTRFSSTSRRTSSVASPSRSATSNAYRYAQPATTPLISRTQFDPSAFVTPPSRNARRTPMISQSPFPEPADPDFWNDSQEAEEDIDPALLDDEELQAYAEEYARLEAAAAFEDIPEDELFDLNWYNENESAAPNSSTGTSTNAPTAPADDEMDLS